MFWSYSNPERTVELKRKNLFIAEFINTSNYNWQGAGELESKIKFIVKKIDGPSINLNFERAHANQYVHYFHTGEVNWEPITATFVSAVDSNDVEVPNWKKLFFNYLNQNLIVSTNRTGLIDFPIFCDYIKITEFSVFLLNKNKDLQFISKNNVPFGLDETYLVTDPSKPKQPIELNTKDPNADNRKQIVQNFFIFKPRINKISFGSYDYSSEESNDITVTFIPEWCDFEEDYIDKQLQR